MSIEQDEEAKLKRAAKLLDEIDMESLLEIFCSLFDSFGNFAVSVGTVQKDHPNTFEALQYLGQMAPKLMSRIVETESPEIVGLFMRIFIRMTTALPRLSNLMDIPPDEKIQWGNELKSFANDLRKLKELRRKEMEKSSNVERK